MNLTKFTRLRNAIANLNLRFVETHIEELRTMLEGRGQIVPPNDLVVTEEGMYYINPLSGMSTKVVLYQAEQWVDWRKFEMREVGDQGYDARGDMEHFMDYHLLRCNLVTRHEREGWKGEFRIVQRMDDRFYVRVMTYMRGDPEDEVFQEVENQRLRICPHCLIKINSLLREKVVYTPETFKLRAFFDAGFEATWRGEYSRERGVLADIYPKDWLEIARKRKEQSQFICEECNEDLSPKWLRDYAHIIHSDHLNRKISYVRLRCVCIACRANQPDGEKFRKSPEYSAYVGRLERYAKEREARSLRKNAPDLNNGDRRTDEGPSGSGAVDGGSDRPL